MMFRFLSRKINCASISEDIISGRVSVHPTVEGRTLDELAALLQDRFGSRPNPELPHSVDFFGRFGYLGSGSPNVVIRCVSREGGLGIVFSRSMDIRTESDVIRSLLTGQFRFVVEYTGIQGRRTSNIIFVPVVNDEIERIFYFSGWGYNEAGETAKVVWSESMQRLKEAGLLAQLVSR